MKPQVSTLNQLERTFHHLEGGTLSNQLLAVLVDLEVFSREQQLLDQFLTRIKVSLQEVLESQELEQ